MATKYLRFATQPFTASFPSLHEPDTKSKFPSGKYEVTAILDPQEHATTIADIEKVIKATMDDGWSADKHADLTNPLKKQNDGTYKIKFRTKSAPTLEDSQGSRLSDEVIIGAGDTVRCACAVTGYDSGSRSGVTVYLNKVRLIEKRSNSFDDFGGPEDGFQATDETTPQATVGGINF